ncbi:hypothetical protein Q7689_00470 [Nocardiopsis tropica]|uniref:hypothetical protein n=1 Tax=Nocardiopsis tropica TaxID=109330 RepID=UPI002E841CC3|nr:hypothetical protein [Nocardiopsis tropica]
MTPQDVASRVNYVNNLRGDDEVAHSEEDDLYADVLQAIADGADSPAALARVALGTKSINFNRWCA